MQASVLGPVARHAPVRVSVARRSVLAVVCAAAIAGVAALGDPSTLVAADPELAWLLRGMAVIKGVLAAGAIAVVAWRLGAPIGRGAAAGYVVGCATIAGATVAIWQLSFIVTAAVAFHAGGLLLLLLAWRDDGPALRRLVAIGRGARRA